MNKRIREIICIALMGAVAVGAFAGCRVHVSGGEKKSGEEEEEAFEEEETEETEQSRELPDEGTVGGYNYRILTHNEYGNLMIDERGYYIDSLDQPNSPFFVVICSGWRATGGYELNITNVDIQGDEFVITVTETAPGPTQMVTQAITYPYCVLELDRLPEDLKVVEANGNEFPNAFDEAEDSSEDVSYRMDVPDGYIAVLISGAGEMMRDTYVYKTETGYEYLNVVSTTVSWGSSQWNHRVTGKGECDTKDEIVEIARQNYSCDYAIISATNEGCTIDEFLASDL